jgi:hypothetical protein
MKPSASSGLSHHESAAIDVHQRRQLALGDRAAVVEQAEHVELPRREVVLGVRCPQAPHRVLTDEGEQQPFAVGALFDHAATAYRRIGLRGGHRQ